MSQTLSDDRPVDPDDELLVAYLDGELDSRQRDEIEQRLMDDQRLRGRLQSLQASWEMLDDLPGTTTNDKLVESTLELVVADIVSKSSIQEAHVEKSRWPLIMLSSLLLAAIAGFGIVRWSQSQTQRRELEDLALAENLDAYLYGQDLELMRDLWSDSQWSNMVKVARDLGGLSDQSKPLIADKPVDERAEAIEALSLEQRASLETKWDRFQRMDGTYRDAVRA